MACMYDGMPTPEPPKTLDERTCPKHAADADVHVAWGALLHSIAPCPTPGTKGVALTMYYTQCLEASRMYLLSCLRVSSATPRRCAVSHFRELQTAEQS